MVAILSQFSPMERLWFPTRLFPTEDQQLTGEITGGRREGVITMQVEVSGQDA